MKYVLILVMNVYGGGGPAMHEFNSKVDCEAAGRAAQALLYYGTSNIKFACVEKSP